MDLSQLKKYFEPKGWLVGLLSVVMVSAIVSIFSLSDRLVTEVGTIINLLFFVSYIIAAYVVISAIRLIRLKKNKSLNTLLLVVYILPLAFMTQVLFFIILLI